MFVGKNAITLKRSNDSDLRANLQYEEEALTRDPGNRDMQANVQRMRATLAADVHRIDDCKYKPATNSCTK